VDGTIDGRITVEVGAGSPKQIWVSVLDLALHPYPEKLLVPVDTPGHSTERSVKGIQERLGCPGVVSRVVEGPDQEEVAEELAEAVDG
jgi:hypothetical protein